METWLPRRQKDPFVPDILVLKDPTSHSSYLRRVLIHWLISKDVDLKLLGITSSLLLAYNEGPQKEGTSHGDTGSRATPSFDKECGRPAKIVLNADKNATEERHPHTVEYVYSSDEEPYISLRKEPKADKNCYKNSTAPEIQNQAKAAEVKQEIEHHQSKSPVQDGHQKETSHTTEDYTEKESHYSNYPVMQESQHEKKIKTDEVAEIKPRKERSKRSAISEFKDQQRTEKQDEVEVKTKKEHHHLNCPVMQASRDEKKTKTDEVTDIKPKKEQSKRSAISEFKDQQAKIKLEKEQSIDPTMIDWQDQRRLETRQETEDEKKEELQKNEEKYSTNDLSGAFKCPFCDQVCNVKSNLKRHINRKHGHLSNENHEIQVQGSGKCQCLDCGFKCHRIGDFRQHLTKSHDVVFHTESRNFSSFSGGGTVSK